MAFHSRGKIPEDFQIRPVQHLFHVWFPESSAESSFPFSHTTVDNAAWFFQVSGFSCSLTRFRGDGPHRRHLPCCVFCFPYFVGFLNQKQSKGDHLYHTSVVSRLQNLKSELFASRSFLGFVVGSWLKSLTKKLMAFSLTLAY